MAISSGPKDPTPQTVACAKLRLDDVGLGERMRTRYGDLALSACETVMMRVAHIGWHVFDGMRWKEDEDERAARPLAHATARAVYDEAELVLPSADDLATIEAAKITRDLLAEMGAYDNGWPEERKREYAQYKAQIAAADKAEGRLSRKRDAINRFAKSACGTSKIQAMLTEAGPYVSRTVDELNTDRLAVNTRAGTVQFFKMDTDSPKPWAARMRDHDSGDLITKCATVHPPEMDMPDPNTHPVFTNFFETVQPNQDVRDFILRYAGLCLTGIVSEQCLLFFLGPGRNGKSTFVDLLCHIMGDYSVNLAIESLAGENRRSGAEATPDLARLPGARLVAASEPEAGVTLKEALVKTLTGGEKFPVRRLQKDFFEVDPHFKIILSGNHAPRIRNTDDGIWRRLHIVPWDIQIPEKDVDRDLPEKLKAEADAIFSLLIYHAIDYLNHGLRVPKMVRDSTQTYRDESDEMGQFIDGACDVTGHPDDRVAPTDLYQAYTRYAAREGLLPFKNSTFNKKFATASKRIWTALDGTKQKFKRTKSSTTFYDGIRIKPEWQTDESSPAPRDDYDDEVPF